MTSKTQKEDLLTRYLLGGLSERERERLEGDYFEDDETFEQMLIAEEDLIDSYVHGELSAAERTQFERHFLSSPEGCERVQFARTLAGAVADARPPQAAEATGATRRGFVTVLRARGTALRFALAAAVLVTLVGIPWLLVERARMRDELSRLRAKRATLDETAQEREQQAAAERARNDEPPARPEIGQAQPTTEVRQQEDKSIRLHRPSPGNSREQPSRPSVASFVLTPGIVRGGGGATLRVPRGASSVALWLNVEADTYASYRAVIETAEGGRVWSADLARPRREPGLWRHLPRAGVDSADLNLPRDVFDPRRAAGARGTIALPALPTKYLPAGDYILRLSGKRPDGEYEGVADYSFRIARK